MIGLFKSTSSGKYNALLSASLVIGGMCIFGLFIHEVSSWRFVAFVGLAIVAATISLSVGDIQSLLAVLGLTSISRKVVLYCLAGITFGMVLGGIYNAVKADSLMPQALTRFALIAPLIGIMEELVFRGFVQSRLASRGAMPSVLVAASGHTLYKYLVIKTLTVDLDTYMPSLIGLTFLVGVVFGILKEASRSVFPPALAHAIFDVMVYGGAIMAPVWIWS
jgi:membrane protease YdiL (CAAX protease family)